MTCTDCGRPAIGIVFTKGSDDVPTCKRCARAAKYAGWDSQSLNTAASATGVMIRNRVKGVK